MAGWLCEKCNGMGMVIVERADGGHLAEPCEACREERRISHLRRRVRIPERFLQCTLDNYRCDYAGADRSLAAALFTSRKFVQEYKTNFRGMGILFTGPVGTGKTHLAVGILQALVASPDRVSALFCDNRQLLKAINNSYNPRVDTTELEVLRPVFEAEVLVLDELGSSIKQTEWVSDMVAHILNTRYNEQRTTIITTNAPNLPVPNRARKGKQVKREEVQSSQRSGPESANSGAKTFDDILNDLDRLTGKRIDPPESETVQKSRTYSPAANTSFGDRSFKGLSGENKADEAARPGDVNDALNATSELTLGDRIGSRMFSRLAEMCVAVELKGADYRQGAKKARFE